MTAAPNIATVRIQRRTVFADGAQRACAEVLMVDTAGTCYCSRLWHELDDTPFNRADQVAQFRRRWALAASSVDSKQNL
jgi:hypothetical protein